MAHVCIDMHIHTHAYKRRKKETIVRFYKDVIFESLSVQPIGARLQQPYKLYIYIYIYYTQKQFCILYIYRERGYIYIYIYIYRDRGGEREREETRRERDTYA